MRRVTKAEALADMAASGFTRGAGACVMCRLAAEADGLRVLDAEHAAVIVDRYPARRGHLLVVPRRHVERATELGRDAFLALQAIVHDAQLAVEAALRPRRVYVASFGSPSDAIDPPASSFPHLHVHVVPIHETGEAARPAAVFSWSANVSLYEPGEGEALAAEIRAAWPRGSATGTFRT